MTAVIREWGTIRNGLEQQLCRPLPRRRLHVRGCSNQFQTEIKMASRPAEMNLMGQVRVILVSPKTPGNIGAAARVCDNFDCSQLWVVAPRCDPLDGDAVKTAVGASALQNLRSVDSLQDALQDCAVSIAFTRRDGASRLVHPSLLALLHRVVPSVDTPEKPNAPLQTEGDLPIQHGVPHPSGDGGEWMPDGLALVFGREESGLSHDELALCAHACQIPSSATRGSMNLSHAVAVALSQLYQLQSGEGTFVGIRRDDSSGTSAMPSNLRELHRTKDPGTQPASAAEVDYLIRKFAEVSNRVGLGSEETTGGTGNHGRKRRTVGHVRAALTRAALTRREVQALHGLCSATLDRLQRTPNQEDGS